VKLRCLGKAMYVMIAICMIKHMKKVITVVNSIVVIVVFIVVVGGVCAGVFAVVIIALFIDVHKCSAFLILLNYLNSFKAISSIEM
jgi:predicted branched-subunit amino acid permease